MNKNDDFFDKHFSFTSIGFGSKERDQKVSKDMKHTVKKHLTK